MHGYVRGMHACMHACVLMGTRVHGWRQGTMHGHVWGNACKNACACVCVMRALRAAVQSPTLPTASHQRTLFKCMNGGVSATESRRGNSRFRHRSQSVIPLPKPVPQAGM